MFSGSEKGEHITVMRTVLTYGIPDHIFVHKINYYYLKVIQLHSSIN